MTSSSLHEGCAGKQAFASTQDAHRAIESIRGRRRSSSKWSDPADIRAYVCTDCGRWHIGTPKSKHARISGARGGRR